MKKSRFRILHGCEWKFHAAFKFFLLFLILSAIGCSVLITTPPSGGRGGSDWKTLAKIFFLITTPPSGGTDLVKM